MVSFAEHIVQLRIQLIQGLVIVILGHCFQSRSILLNIRSLLGWHCGKELGVDCELVDHLELLLKLRLNLLLLFNQHDSVDHLA